jgi:ribose 5-phosphate isomerase B
MTNSRIKITLACDHAGFNLKEFLKKELQELNYQVLDCGCFSDNVSVDYPDYAQKACMQISDLNNSKEFAILICGSGIGISISANRNKHIRAAVCSNIKLAKLSRAHNNANVLCFGARFIKNKSALAITKVFLQTKFEGGRHEARIAKLSS